MKHLEASFTGKNQFWRYLVMIALIIVVLNTIGVLPLLVSLVVRSLSNPEVLNELAANKTDLSVLGLGPNMGLFVMIFPFIAGLIAFILLVRPIHSRSFSNTINGTGKIRWNRFFISASVWLVLQAIFLLIYLKVDPGNFTINNKTASLITLILISLLIIPFQASFEEVLFRGYFMQGFTALVKNRWFPLIMTSILFGLLHAFNPEVKEYGFLIMMPQYVLFGLIFGLSTVLDDGIEAAMGAHTANNIFVCIMVTQESSALQTDALFEQHNIYPWADFLGLLVTGIVFLLILKVIFKWDDLSVIFGKVRAKEEVQTP